MEWLLYSLVCAGSIALAAGGQPPAFVPPEESLESGGLPGMFSALVEEPVMRVALTLLLFVFLSVLTTIVIAALCLVLWHEARSGAAEFVFRHAFTRLMIPLLFT